MSKRLISYRWRPELRSSQRPAASIARKRRELLVAKQLGFYLNAAACNGCSVCLVASKDKYDNPVGVNFRNVIHHSMGTWEERSEEHTSELQSLMRISYAVFCLNKKIIQYYNEQ